MSFTSSSYFLKKFTEQFIDFQLRTAYLIFIEVGPWPFSLSPSLPGAHCCMTSHSFIGAVYPISSPRLAYALPSGFIFLQ